MIWALLNFSHCFFFGHAEAVWAPNPSSLRSAARYRKGDIIFITLNLPGHSPRPSVEMEKRCTHCGFSVNP